MSYEDRLYVWLLACWHGMAYWNKRGLLVSAPQALRELNALTDGPQIREAQIARIVAEFKNTSPPYVSFDPALQQDRAADRAEVDRLRKRKSRGAGYIGSGPPDICAKSADAPIEIIRKKAAPRGHRGSPKHTFGYVLVNGVPQWNNGARTLHLELVRKAA